MSGILDFLFEGKPPASVTTYGTTTENMPKWLSDYTQGLISRANSVAAEPYQAYTGPRLAGQTADQTAGYGQVRSTIAPTNAGFQQLMQSPGAVQAAQPYINQAAQTFPGAVNQYMNPYIENVIGRSTTLANRALNEKFMPALSAKFGTRGSDVRSSAYLNAANRGVRDITENLHEQANAQLANAYNSAAQTFGADASRMGALAGTVGNMTTNDALARGTLLEGQQRAGLTGAAALDTIGRAQQGEQQRSLDLAQQDFQEQRDYPRSTLDWMSNIIRGLPTDRQVSSTSTGPADVYGASPLSQIASLGTGIGGIMQAVKAKGGRVKARRKRVPKVRAKRGTI